MDMTESGFVDIEGVDLRLRYIPVFWTAAIEPEIELHFNIQAFNHMYCAGPGVRRFLPHRVLPKSNFNGNPLFGDPVISTAGILPEGIGGCPGFFSLINPDTEFYCQDMCVVLDKATAKDEASCRVCIAEEVALSGNRTVTCHTAFRCRIGDASHVLAKLADKVLTVVEAQNNAAITGGIYNKDLLARIKAKWNRNPLTKSLPHKRWNNVCTIGCRSLNERECKPWIPVFITAKLPFYVLNSFLAQLYAPQAIRLNPNPPRVRFVEDLSSHIDGDPSIGYLSELEAPTVPPRLLGASPAHIDQYVKAHYAAPESKMHWKRWIVLDKLSGKKESCVVGESGRDGVRLVRASFEKALVGIVGFERNGDVRSAVGVAAQTDGVLS